jgi:apolipoprotein N-acyltransferase
MRELFRRLEALSPWRRRGLALALGALGVLAFAPFHLVPLFAVSLIGLFLLAQQAPRRRAAFSIAWWWGFGHFAAGNYWIANSFLIDAARFGWMVPPIIGGLAAYLALYPALAASLVWERRGSARVDISFPRILAFAGAWILAEWLRGHVLTGYPWNLAAYVWDISLPMMQSVALWGSWGLGFFTVLAFTLPAALFAGEKKWRWQAGLVAPLVILCLLWAGGFLRLSGAATDHVPGVMLRIVQANISQAEKLQGGFAAAHLDKHLTLTQTSPGFDKVTHVVWPESAANFLLDREPELRRAMSAAVPPNGALITGSLRGAPESGELAEIWNSLLVLDGAGKIVAQADKFHLVPLGEFVPFRRFFPFINKLTPGSMDFSAALGPQTISIPNAPSAGPLICYEVIFPGAVADESNRPQFLLNVTNDGWFGFSPGPFQHFTASRFRAVEEGLPLLRAANTGISAMVNAYGAVEARSSLGEVAIIDVELPVALDPTPFSSLGLVLPGLLALMVMVPMVIFRRST